MVYIYIYIVHKLKIFKSRLSRIPCCVLIRYTRRRTTRTQDIDTEERKHAATELLQGRRRQGQPAELDLFGGREGRDRRRERLHRSQLLQQRRG